MKPKEQLLLLGIFLVVSTQGEPSEDKMLPLGAVVMVEVEYWFLALPDSSLPLITCQ
jgi:hypothetical protein